MILNENNPKYPITIALMQIKQAAKEGVWVSKLYHLNNGETLGIKAFGKWVQRIEYKGIRSDIPEQKTWKAFEDLFTAEITKLLSSSGT